MADVDVDEAAMGITNVEGVSEALMTDNTVLRGLD